MDYPLPIIKNPHEQFLSVNEASALGIEDIPDMLLAPDFDRYKLLRFCKQKKWRI